MVGVEGGGWRWRRRMEQGENKANVMCSEAFRPYLVVFPAAVEDAVKC